MPCHTTRQMAPALSAITDIVHFAHTDLVNWTLVTDDSGVMLIDAGFPGSRDDVLASLRELGFGVDDLRAILLTHAHIDHFGSAIWFAKTHGTPVYCHADEVGHAKREYLEQASPVDVAAHVWQPRWLKWSVAISRKGAFTRDGIPTAQALTEDVAAGLPGRADGHSQPRAHRRALLVRRRRRAGQRRRPGDGPSGAPPAPARSCCTRCSTTTRTAVCAAWPRWRCSTPRCSLPGHGQVWRGPIREAAQSRRALRSPAGRSRSGTARSTARTWASGSCRRDRRRPRFRADGRSATAARAGDKRQPGGGEEQPPYGRLRNVHPTTPPPLRATASAKPIGRGGRAGCDRRIRCGMRHAPAAAAPPGRRSRRGRAG